MGWVNEEGGVRYLAEARGVSLVLTICNGSVTYTHPTQQLYNKTENRVDHAPPSSAEV